MFQGQWDGNIGKQSWKNDTEGQRSYVYSYDPSKRLKTANYSGVNGEDFSLPQISYDKNGNIKTLQRFGSVGNAYGLLDNLTYTHNGNRLSQITDTQSSNNGGEFVQRGNASYTFYADGSLQSDANEQLQNIIYDTFLKQPTELQLTDGRKIKNYYDGSGTLLKTVYFSAGSTVIESWEYVGDLVYKNGVLYQINDDEGRILYENGTYVYEFSYQDHLGNTRVSFKAVGNQLTKTAESHFDPWGVRLMGVGSINGIQNRWEFLNREKESTFGLNYIRLGARGYNPTIGRFDRVEPIPQGQENWSVYQYGYDNPIRYTDANGLEPNLHFEGAAAQEAFRGLQNNTPSFQNGDCPSCPQGDNYSQYHKSSSLFTFDSETSIVYNGSGEATVRAKAQSRYEILLNVMSTESDANSISLGADVAFGGGLGFELSAIRINKGDDQGWHFYGTFNANVGLGGGLGFSVNAIDFNENNTLNVPFNRLVFPGESNAYSGGVGIWGASYSWTPVDNNPSLNPFKEKVYDTKGGGIGVGVNIGLMWQRTYTKLFRD